MSNYIAIIFILFLTVQDQDYKTIDWSEEYRLQWYDFKGNPKPNSGAVAVTASGITLGYSATTSDNDILRYNFEVTAQFYPEKSWVIKERSDIKILEHERLHFDITELHARKFRKQLKASNFTKNINEEVEIIYQNINKQLKIMQELYDKETNHSQNFEAQIRWQKDIKNELKTISKNLF